MQVHPLCLHLSLDPRGKFEQLACMNPFIISLNIDILSRGCSLLHFPGCNSSPWMLSAMNGSMQHANAEVQGPRAVPSRNCRTCEGVLEHRSVQPPICQGGRGSPHKCTASSGCLIGACRILRKFAALSHQFVLLHAAAVAVITVTSETYA